jgi:hypothetical protein
MYSVLSFLLVHIVVIQIANCKLPSISEIYNCIYIVYNKMIKVSIIIIIIIIIIINDL